MGNMTKPKKEPELKSCPFCGEKPFPYLATESFKPPKGVKALVWVYCNDCDAMGAAKTSVSAAIRAWNRRAKK